MLARPQAAEDVVGVAVVPRGDKNVTSQ
jgi:hypothetical protein